MVAAEYNKLPIVMALIKHGANLNLQDDLGKFTFFGHETILR